MNIKSLNELKPQVQDSINSLRRELSAQVLDGNPYLVVVDMSNLDGIGGSYPAVFGEWPEKLGSDKIVRGWRSLELASHTFDGAILCSRESADQKVRDLHSLGFRSAHMLHKRDVLKERLARAEQLFMNVFGEAAK